MSIYFNNNSNYNTHKLNRVLAQRERNTKIINELARRRNIGISEKGKKKKRKLKSKGKHRKKKEITITDEPTQKVKGYSVVNVISAKRGKYKPRRQQDDKRYPDVAPMWFKDGKGIKGTQWSPVGLDKYSGLMKSMSDNRFPKDPKARAEMKTLKEQVDRIERRLMNPTSLRGTEASERTARTQQTGPLDVVKAILTTPLGPLKSPTPSPRPRSEAPATPEARTALAAEKRIEKEARRGLIGKEMWSPKGPPWETETDYSRYRRSGSPDTDVSERSRSSDFTKIARAQQEAEEKHIARIRPPSSVAPSMPVGSEAVTMPSEPVFVTEGPPKPPEDVGAPSPSPSLASSPTPPPPPSYKPPPRPKVKGQKAGKRRQKTLEGDTYQKLRDAQAEIATQLYDSGLIPETSFARRGGIIRRLSGGGVQLNYISTQGKGKEKVINYMKRQGTSEDAIKFVVQAFDEHLVLEKQKEEAKKVFVPTEVGTFKPIDTIEEGEDTEGAEDEDEEAAGTGLLPEHP